ncbi:class I SAM-dependent methyltransferase [Streptomyces sp. NPDC057445]|uniref:class I SAM-dependent methyltransferase n=1 Tax=Streptomyces sp. NPDC057445 TaxID=3346136 RepID=UPI0036A5E306
MLTTTQETFLREFHAAHPAVTARCMAHGRAADGRSSYEILRDRVTGCRRVLDLGCGDGLLLELLAADSEGRELAGVDLSPEDLTLARRRPLPAGTRLLEARAQELPFPAGSFDACVSHMALMLMADADQVVAEAARVLAPGGVLALATGGGAVDGEAYDVFLRLLRPLIGSAPAEQRIPALGDRRVRSREGLDELLGPAGFSPVDRDTVRIDLSGSLEQVWDVVSGVYDLGPVDIRTIASLREAFTAETESMVRPDGTIPCGMKVHIASSRMP